MKHPSLSFSSLYIQRCFKINFSRSSDNDRDQDETVAEKQNIRNVLSDNSAKRKSGGWTAISFILG